MSEKAKVLIIEDDQDAASAMKATLESQGCDVSHSGDPEAGFQKAKQEKPDLIILDVMFGDAGATQGFDYAVKMKQDKALAPIPILMVTAVNLRKEQFKFSPQTDGEYLPVDDFIDKPAQPDDLVHKAKSLIDQKVSKWVNWPHPKE
jgi:DNA-binding response OmpR family regulator